jgi:L-fuculose-phosphate aldolase
MRVVTEYNPNILLVDALHRLERLGPCADTSVSTRSGGGLLIAWGALGESEPLTTEHVVFIARDGGIKGRSPQRAPDWALHQAIYVARAEVQAVVHVQSTYATALASLRRSLPAFHPGVAIAGGDSVPCVPYQTPGSNALASAVVDGLSRRTACLIAHDGLITTGGTVSQATACAISIEFLCQSYLAALTVGEPPRLDRAEIALALERLQHQARPPRN